MDTGSYKPARHNPPHWFCGDAVYMLTGSIYQGADLMGPPHRKAAWRDAFLSAAGIYHWQVIAWAVLHNHYHAIVLSPYRASTLSAFVNSYHKFTARKWNAEDGLQGRKVWWNYWDSCIRSDKDYSHRLAYVFWNPVKHGLAARPGDYPFSSYREFLEKEPDFDFVGIDEVTNVPEY